MNSKISILLPVWNGEKWIKECIDSILKQTYKNFELLIVDDGSTDRSIEIVRSYNDPRIRIIQKEHSGISDTLNLGIHEASGEYIARMDADDIMFPDRLQYQIGIFKSDPDLDILGCGFNAFGKDVWYCRPPEKERLGKSDFLTEGNVIAHPTVMMKKQSLLQLPYIYDSWFDGCEDLRLWYHVLDNGLSIRTSQTPVLHYRTHEQQVSSLGNQPVNEVRKVWEWTEDGAKITALLPESTYTSEELDKLLSSIRATARSVFISVPSAKQDPELKRIALRFGATFKEPDNGIVAEIHDRPKTWEWDKNIENIIMSPGIKSIVKDNIKFYEAP